MVNFDLPQTNDDYIHRVGRTGRVGQEGRALTFVDGMDETNRIKLMMTVAKDNLKLKQNERKALELENTDTPKELQGAKK